MQGGRLVDHSKPAMGAVQTLFVRRLKAACHIVESRARQRLAIEGTGKRVKGGGVVRHTGGKAKRIYGAFPSKPGESPHKQTGRLRASVATEVVGMTGRVGTNVKYGLALEKGAPKINLKPRPWLLRSFIESLLAVKQILRSGGATGFKLN